MRSRRGTEHCGGRIGARLGCSLAAPRWGDSQHHASTTARHAAARAMFMENRRCKCTWSLRRSIFDLHVASLRPISWRQALAGSTLRSSARGRRGPPPVARNGRRGMSSLGIDPEPEQHPPRGAPGFAARESGGRRGSRIGAPVPPAQPAPPCVAASHRSGLVGQLSVPVPGAAKGAHPPARHRRVVATRSRITQ